MSIRDGKNFRKLKPAAGIPGLVAFAALLLGSWLPLQGAEGEATATTFAKEIQPALVTYCFRCHNEGKQEGGVNLAAISSLDSLAKQRKVWRKAAERIGSQEMPPDSEPQPPAELREQLASFISAEANKSACGEINQRDPGPPGIRRLTRAEYNRTIKDLLGFSFDSGEVVGMPEEPAGTGFANQVELLSIPPALMDKYFAAASEVTARLFAQELPEQDESRKKFFAAPAQAEMLKQAYETILFAKPGEGVTEAEAAQKILLRFASYAFRRPATKVEVTQLMQLYEVGKKPAASHSAGLKLALQGILVSPYFLFRIEEDRPAAAGMVASRVSDYELAVRLSYYLWSSMPDKELFKLAGEKKLSDPQVLEAQVRRMLADPKAKALTEEFAVQWLQLKKLATARPSTEFFPTFTPALRQAMYDETVAMFDHLRQEDRSLLELLDCDYAFVNEDLAKHYGLPEVQGKEIRRVGLKPDDKRGSLLTMGSVLALTSHTSRTSPTLRGKYLLEVVLGTPPAPPPANVGNLEDAKKDGVVPKTFREKMALHAQQAQCASCHVKIDPLGFGLENFDAIGRWRDSTAEQPLDTVGQLPGGVKFAGPMELRKLILTKRDRFVQNATEQLLAFALGRELQYYDDCSVLEITKKLEAENFKFSTLVLEIVRSYPFQYRRGDAKPEEKT